MVLKPTSQTPFSALALCVLAERAGVPGGVISCITGTASAIGAEMASNPVVRKLSFTGSTEIGKTLLAQCASTIKRTSMELGGNAPFIVFDDADLDDAVDGVIASKYRNAGQTCVCVNRLLVQDGVYDTFVEKLVAKVEKLKIGDGLEPGVEIGPLIDKKAVARGSEHVTDAVAKGARIATGSLRHAKGGNFYEPTVLVDATREMMLFREETFGPVAPVFVSALTRRLSRLPTIPNSVWLLIFTRGISGEYGGSRRDWITGLSVLTNDGFPRKWRRSAA